MRRLSRVSMAATVIALLALLLLWLVLASPLFRGVRVNMAEHAFSELVGQPVVIEGDVRLAFAMRPALVATGLRLPSETFPTVDLAKLGLARFVLSVPKALRTGIYLQHVEAHGLEVFLIRGSDGKTTWRLAEPAEGPEGEEGEAAQKTDLIAFLGEREIVFRDMWVHAENQMTGFEFDLKLDAFDIQQTDAQNAGSAHVESAGRINGQAFSFSGEFPNDASFAARGQFGDLNFVIAGQKPSGLARGNFDGRLRLETADVQNLLELLRLEGDAEASAVAEMQIVRRDRRIDLHDIEADAVLKKGPKARLTGRYGDARFGHDFDLTLSVDFIGDNEPPPPAIFLRDIRARNAELRVVARNGEIAIERVDLQTNAFEEEVRDIGPFRVESVSRSRDGKLRLDGVTLVIGPEGNPYLRAEGHIDNLLTLRGYSMTGALDLPARGVLLTLLPEEAAAFGRVTGGMFLEEVNGVPNLRRFELRSKDTDLWSALLDVKASDVLSMQDFVLSAYVNTPNGEKLLKAMRFDPVDVGYLGYDLVINRKGRELLLDALLTSGTSTVGADVSIKVGDGSPVIRGLLQSDDVSIPDVRNKLLALGELARFKSVYIDSRKPAASASEEEFQPLVLVEDDVPVSEWTAPEDDLSEFQPLIVAPEGEDLSDYQPLVETGGLADLSLEEVANPREIVRRIDAEIDIDIARITGQAGVSKLQSRFEMKSGEMQLGPVNLAYGKGFADVTARMDLADAPEWLRLTGRAGGWDFGDILDALNANIGAYGTLSGDFDLTGRAAAASFLRSMRGSATINMKDGRLGTGLIELAGLGVLPWLFSQERRQGFAEIVCIRAPLRFSAGRIDTGQSVLETRRVQLVGSGTVDLNAETISFVAEPRPVGKPLSRSAWPISVTGNLKSPSIKVAQRTKRRAMVPLSMPEARTPCVPDVAQLTESPGGPSSQRPR